MSTDNLNVSPEVKKAIVDALIAEVSQAIYAWVIRQRVAVRCDDEAGKKKATDELEKLEKRLDALRDEEKALLGGDGK